VGCSGATGRILNQSEVSTKNWLAERTSILRDAYRSYGKRIQRPFSTLRGAYIVTSCRKFDVFGDWCVLRNPLLIWRLLKGKNQTDADTFYYDFER
jgi:hypothetical protein